ncbi:patatin-like phospholipase family protein [Hahella ganghwensis]|uniref:patatin-like phospholipase family protein n=1 Tax=Hahella ganghwensis TaxID=286420 RepID=UPI0003822A05|nr:patatin-like phospholipase family protein [Hahella ganghwensis]
MSSSLTVIAGRRACALLKENGFRQELFNGLAAASGGPKWFILFGLDRYLFGDFFRDRLTPLHTVGSSAGAWQMSCFAQQDPVAAITRLADYYSHETYSDKPTTQEITDQARVMVQHMLGSKGAEEIASNSLIQTHLLANRCRGLVASEAPWLQTLGLGLAATANAISRKWLGTFFERAIFHAGARSHYRFDDFNTRYIRLTPENVEDALMASGSIPLVLQGVQNINGAPTGTYRDGGIIDYHFDLPFRDYDGLLLYPHFSQEVTPGWFDKKLSYRRVAPENYDNVVLLTPSTELIDRLPYQKISDRNDFKNLDTTTRQKYWQTVLNESQRMAEDLDAMIHHGKGLENIRLIAE